MAMKNFLIAYSGGLDSTVLLHAFSQLRGEFDSLRAVHIHHGLSAYADAWEAHCREQCRLLTIPLEVHALQLKKIKGESLEAQAREGRYGIFREVIQKGEILVTAHHQNDQAETLLLQLFRGAGPKGLSAMPWVGPFGKGFIFRPLLSCSRERLREYATRCQLTWVEDESNAECHLDRNYMRHEALPVMQRRWPSVIKTLARSSHHMAEASTLLHELTVLDFQAIKTEKQNQINVKALAALSIPRQKNVVRYWIHHLHCPLPDEKRLNEILHQMVFAKHDANPVVKWQQVEMRRYRDKLYLLHSSKTCKDETMLCLETQHEIYNSGRADHGLPLRREGNYPLSVGVDRGRPKNMAQGLTGDTEEGVLAIRSDVRKNMGKVKVKNRKGHHDLKKIFQEKGVPPWERETVPLLFEGEELVGIEGYDHDE